MRRQLALSLVVLLALATPAAAWDPDWADWWWEEEPVVWHDPQPVDDVWWWQEPAWEPAPPSPPTPAIPSGIYYVTEVYVADVVTVSGPVTSYSTATMADTPGTYARVADTVTTGAASPFDGTSFNGRASLHDGRPVAGTYYENFVIADGSFVSVSVVFFQEDADIAITPTPTAPPRPSPAPTTPPVPTPVLAPSPAAPPAPTPVPSRTAAPATRSDPIAEPPAEPSPRRIPSLRPGVASGPLGDIAFSLEVLRGRPIVVWLRAVADGVTVPVSTWHVVGGEHTALGPVSGGRDDPFRARWDTVTRPDASWPLRVEATVIVDGVTYPANGDIAVVVRSPALIR